MAARVLGLMAGLVVALATFSQAGPAEMWERVAPAASASSNAWAGNDPHLLFLASQMELALGDVNSAVALADRAASLERTKKEPAVKPKAVDDDCPFSKAAGGQS